MTLADLLVSTAVLGLTLSATLVTLEQGQQAWTVGAARVDAQQSGRAALAWLAAELRAAGQGTGPRTVAALSAVEPTRVVLHVDRNRDGTLAATDTVTWRLAGDVLRRDAGGGAQPVVNGVGSLELRYFDARGLPTSVAAEVRSVVVALSTVSDGASATSPTTAVSTRVRLRNR